MGVLVWFAPWAVYWVLVGHVPPSIAAALALAMALAVVAGDHGRPARLVGGGAVATFTVLAALPLAGDAAAPRWLLPVSFAGLLAVLLAAAPRAGRWWRTSCGRTCRKRWWNPSCSHRS